VRPNASGSSRRHSTAAKWPSIPTCQDRIIGEPCGRDTAACIGLGAALIDLDDPDAVMMVTPADHVIEPVQNSPAAHVAQRMIEEHPHALVTFGFHPPIQPRATATSSAATDWGAPGSQCFSRGLVPRKTQCDLAEQWVVSGQYFWNSGIFFWKRGRFWKP